MIRVEISNGKLNPINHDVTIGTIIMAALKGAGIPVAGSAFVLRGIERGSLNYYTDNDTHHYTWRENDEDRDGKFVRSMTKGGCVVYKSGKHLEDDEL